MDFIRGIAEKFGLVAAPPPPQDDSVLRAMVRVGKLGDDLDNTVNRMKEVLGAMGLPLPKHGSMMHGAEGVLMFLDDYGIMLRLEVRDDLVLQGNRIDDHPMILQPLGQRYLNEYAVLEICPGVNVHRGRSGYQLLQNTLPDTGVELFDKQACNTGLLPFKTPAFPDGVPVVLDRLAVKSLDRATQPVKDALSVFGLSHDVQQQAYASLKGGFTRAWPDGQDNPDPAKFKEFLQECIRAKAQGILVSGWMRDPNANPNDWMYEDSKRRMAVEAGQSYAKQIKAFQTGQ